MASDFSYCADLVRRQDYDRFLTSLFVPAPGRGALLAVLALNAELAQVRGAVSEEMIGHIRLAWWQEAIEALYGSGPRKGHPVLEALATVAGRVPQAGLLSLVEVYRARFPEPPPEAGALLDALSENLISVESQAGWRKARGIIARHRARHGKKGNGWLSLKLLMAGVM